MSNIPTFDPELEDPRSLQIAAAMRAEGVDPYVKVQVDFFAAGEDAKTVLADGVSFITHKVLMEGDRKKYMKSINRDIKIQKATGDALMKMVAGEDRSALLRVAVTGWNLIRDGKPFLFSTANLDWLLDNAPVAVIEQVERDVKKNNPWLFQDATVEDIDEEIERLQELRVTLLEREEGNGDSAK
jgi:hypothetical protein